MKHRILGIVVVVAIVIISLPLFQSGGNEPAEKLVTAPIFPDQTAQVSTAGVETKPAALQTSPIPLHDPSAETGINQLPDDTIAPSVRATPNNPPQAPAMVSPSENNANTAEASPEDDSPGDDDDEQDDPAEKSDKAVTPDDVSQLIKNSDSIFKNSETIIESPTPAPIMKKAEVVKKPAAQSVARTALKKLNSNDIDGLFKLKNSVWVIQLGSFKNKENALRLVNKLRLNGYHAFIQRVANNTRVFVGPEAQQSNARTLAGKLKTDMNISGVVVSYKPLTL